MKTDKSLISKVVSMSSLEIAKLTGKRHDNVVRDIEKMFTDSSEENARLNFEASYKDPNNRPRKCYNLDFEWTLTLITGYNVGLRRAIIGRWKQLEEAESVRLQNAKVWHLERNSTKKEWTDMSLSIKENRIRHGKEVKDYHFVNEANMINRIIVGCTSAQFKKKLELEENESIRDQMENRHLAAYSYLQNANTTLLNMDMPFDERKRNLATLLRVKFAELPSLIS